MRKVTMKQAQAMVSGLMLAALVVACSSRSEDSGTVPPPATSSPSASPSAGPATSSTADSSNQPEIVTWGGHDQQLAIIIRNQGPRNIRSAKVHISATDADGNQIVSTTGEPDSTCCTIFGLAPGQQFGLFVNMTDEIDDVADVAVRYVDAQFAPATPKPEYTIAAQDAELHHTADDAVVTATVTADGDVTSTIAGQVFLTDDSDRLVAVISGRFYCFASGVSKRLTMQLLVPAPEATHIQKIVAYPIPAGADSHTKNSCK